MEPKIFKPTSKNNFRFAICVFASCLIHICFLLFFLPHTIMAPEKPIPLMVTVNASIEVAPVQKSSNISPTVEKSIPKTDLAGLHPEIEKEVRRMLIKKENMALSSAPLKVFDLCKENKEILGIGVRLSFSDNRVLAVPEYMPAYAAGIRDDDYLETKTEGDVAYVTVTRADEKFTVTIPMINLCNIVRKDF